MIATTLKSIGPHPAVLEIHSGRMLINVNSDFKSIMTSGFHVLLLFIFNTHGFESPRKLSSQAIKETCDLK